MQVYINVGECTVLCVLQTCTTHILYALYRVIKNVSVHLMITIQE